MFNSSTYRNRRSDLCEKMKSGVGLLIGLEESGMNASANTYRYRQDSSFLYYLGIDLPALFGIIDFENGETTLFGQEITIDDIIWTGDLPKLSELATKRSIERVKPRDAFFQAVNEAKSMGREIHYLPAYRADMKINLHKALNLSFGHQLSPSKPFIEAVVAQRSIKSSEEIVEIEKAVDITTDMHLAAMKSAKAGKKEHEVLAAVQSVVNAANTMNSFTTILSVRGEILHNHHYDNELKSGQLLLCDCGAESGMRYAGDMTRTFPVDGTFSQKQKEIYQIVLDAKNKAAEYIQPGEQYKTAHLEAAKVIIGGLKQLGLMKGDIDEALAAGAHALFFPHGLGHMMGLDVHDMEALGEDHVGYDSETQRSGQFGLAFLRLGKRLKEGYVLTNEPGIYFIPQLIDKWKSENNLAEFLNYDAIEKYKDFGGIRLEDDFLVTNSGSRILGNPPPITIDEVEQLRKENS